MSYTVCNAVTHPVSNHVTNVVRTSVQNQNQNQRFWLRLLVVVLGEGCHPSHRNLGLELLPQSAHDRPRTRPHMDAKRSGGGMR